MVKLIVKKSACVLAMIVIMAQLSFTAVKRGSKVATTSMKRAINATANKYAALYDSLHLGVSGLSKQAFDYAVTGYNYLLSQGKIKNDGVLSIVDFSLPSSAKRLFVIDLKNYAVLFNTYVSHGRNSGKAIANEFSNAANSFKSSLGFYVTSGTYKGKHGYSLRLEGEEQGINDNALSRGIVMHCAPYVSEDFIKRQGYIGRSQGCPAIPSTIYKPIIEKIKDGSCLFMYSPDKFYMSHSEILKNLSVA